MVPRREVRVQTLVEVGGAVLFVLAVARCLDRALTAMGRGAACLLNKSSRTKGM